MPGYVRAGAENKARSANRKLKKENEETRRYHMKKTIAIILLAVVCLTFFACAGKGGETGTETTTTAPAAGYTLKIGTVTIAMRENATDALAVLGTPKSREATAPVRTAGRTFAIPMTILYF